MGLKIINNPKAYATEFEKFTWELEWHPDKSYSKPITVSICCQNLCSFILWKWIHVDADEGEIDYRTVPEPDYNDMKIRNPHMKLISVKYPSIEENEKMKFSITAQPYPQEGNSPLLELYAGEIAGKAEEKGSARLTFRPGPVARFSVYAHPYPRESGIVRIIGVPQDRFGNSTSFDRPVDIRYCVEDKQGPSLEVLNKHIFEVNVNKQRNPVRIRAHIPIDMLNRGETIQNASRKRDEFVIYSNPVMTDCPKGLIPAFGDFHWHTKLSNDGWRTMDEAYYTARDALNLNFAAPGDHRPGGKKWSETVDITNKFNDPGRFVTFFGFEQSSDKGHLNFYFLDPQHPMNPDSAPSGRPGGYIEDIKYTEFIAVPHHTNAVAKERRDDGTPYWGPYPWGKPREYIRLVEIFQLEGNFEKDKRSEEWRIWHEGHGSSVQDALEKGHKLGFTGGTDNHTGRPGCAFASTGKNFGMHYWSQSITGLWVKELTRQGIFEALWKRHTWACMDTRAVVRFTVNDALQGDEMTISEPQNLTADLAIFGSFPLEKVEIVSNRKSIWKCAPKTLDMRRRIPLGKMSKDTYFYVRARESSGGIMYSSPIFITIMNLNR